ncbi:S8 family serine peptidase [Emticicia sp. C21]|uniref:S8 family peptidase n=1 Tax=Emticicia sp. C21 TaxID=2302915 RepID=UPI000E341EBA|nr:S8 family serine peptidase [Emticicia sp. C21]RFS15424.1 hypothetical protein D0T08_14825 [Emticicia sp. C21]
MQPNALSSFIKLLGLIVFLISHTAASQTINQGKTYSGTEIYVKLKPGEVKFLPNASSAIVNVSQELTALQNMMQKYQYTQAIRPFYFSKSDKLQQVYRIQISDSTMVEKFVAELNKNPLVEYAERIPIATTQFIETATQPALDKDWHLNTIKALQVFNTVPSKAIIPVAVIDAFMQVDHPDLFSNMIFCEDVANNDFDVRPPRTSIAHGTHVSGIIGAVSNNGIGATGVGFNRVKVIGLNAATNLGALPADYEAVVKAIELGYVRVINMSWSSTSYSETENTIIQLARQAGIILVASAGNTNTNQLRYPAAFDGVIAVASTNIQDVKSLTSCFGEYVDISAPGEDIYSTIPVNGYAFLTGTSMASPLVTGAIGFLLSIKPEMSATTIEALIKNTADDISVQNPTHKLNLGYGRLNLQKAVECMNTHSSDTNFSINTNSTGSYCIGQSYQLQVPTNATGAQNTYQWYKDGDAIAGATVAIHTINAAGTYTVTVTNNNCPRKSALLSINLINCQN